MWGPGRMKPGIQGQGGGRKGRSPGEKENNVSCQYAGNCKETFCSIFLDFSGYDEPQVNSWKSRKQGKTFVENSHIEHEHET